MSSIRLDKAFTEGILADHFMDAANDVIHPSKNHMWLLLSGSIQHVTGTDTVVRVYKYGESALRQSFKMTILAAVAGGQYPIFNTDSDPMTPQNQLVIITENDRLVITAGAAWYAYLRFLEWMK